MTRRGEKTYNFDLKKIGVNLSATPHGGLKGAEATISQNMDYSDPSGALAGRRGTKTIAGAQALGGAGIDLYRAYNGITGKYTLVTFREGGYTKIGAWKAGETEFHTLKLTGTDDDFTLTDNTRVSFTTDYDPALSKVVVAGTNGIEPPFYWDFTEWGNVTPFTFGTTDIKLKYFMPTPYGFSGRGRRWAYFRNNELVTIHASDPDNHCQFVDEGESIFFEVPQEDYSNPLRAILPYRNQIVALNLNSISTVYYTGNTDRFYDYSVMTYDGGTLSPRMVTYYKGMVIFIDKREPYLFAWDGSRIQALDNDRKLTKAIQKWVDFTKYDEIKIDVHQDTLLIQFPSRSHAYGGDGNNWICTINLARLDEYGNHGFPASFYNIRSNDILVTDTSTDFGQVLYIDKTENYVRRFYDHFDEDVDGNGVFGDNNDQTGGSVANIPYRLMTGWISFGDLFRVTEFNLNADYAGAPAAGDILKIRYRFNGWDSWNDLLVGAVRRIQWVPLPKTAYGREIQFDMLWTTKTARPFLYDMAFKYVKFPQTRRLRA